MSSHFSPHLATPPNFSPFLANPQVLKYEPGQFYKAHHDQNSGLFTPQGPRVRARVSAAGAKTNPKKQNSN